MKKRLSLALGTALLMSQFGFAQESTGFKPHHEPLIKQNPPKPNILMVLDTSGSMNTRDMTNAYGPATRIAVLREMVKDLLIRYRHDAYIGFTILGPRAADYAYQGSYPFDILKLPISDLSGDDEIRKAVNIADTALQPPPNTNLTPLTFAIYEAAKVLRGKPRIKETVRGTRYDFGHWKVGPPDPAPIRYRCQEQHMILMTDGDGFYDAIGVPDLVPGDPYSLVVKNPRGKERELIDYSVHTKFLWSLDLRKDATFSSNVDDAGKGWLSDGSKRMPIHFNAISFGRNVGSNSQSLLRKAVSYTVDENDKQKGVYVHATDTSALHQAFHQIFQSIIQTRSGTGAVEDQNAQTLNTIRYTTSYEPRVWTGAIVARRYDSKTGKFSIPVWDTKERIQPGQGKLYTAEVNNKRIITRELYEEGWHRVVYSNGYYHDTWREGYYGSLGKKYVHWLKGYEDPELRDRQGNVLGAIINSDIYHFSSDVPNVNINETVVGKVHRDNIIKYVKKRRDTMGINYLITGSNDGLINFVVAEKTNSSKRSELPGTRVFSYFPSFFKDDLAEITNVPYTHRYKVDGTTHLFDALVDDHYRTIGVTSMGSGARALVGYQIFESDSEFKKTTDDFKINFEIINKTAGFENLGYTYSEVDYINQVDGNGTPRAIAVFGNGFGAPSKVSSIYMIDAVTGKKIEEIILSNDGQGAASPSLLVSKDPVTELQRLESIYVGDYSGDMYKIVFDYTSPDKGKNNNFKNYTKKTLFQSGGSTRPITTRPVVMKHKKDNDQIWIYFGTGSAKTAKDISPEALKHQHYFYGIKDINETIKDGQLIEQKVEKMFGTGKERQLLTTKAVDGTTTSYGWKLKLTHRSDENNERVIRPAVLVGNKYITLATWSLVRGGKNDPCLGDNLVGSEFTLDLYTGNAGTIFWETNPDGSLKGIDKDGKGEPIRAKYNGEHLDDDAFGRPTGEGIIPHNIYGGNYYYGFIEELASSDGYYVDLSKDSGNQSGMIAGNPTIDGKKGGKFSLMSSTTEGGKQKNKVILQDDIWESEDGLTSGKRLYIKQRAL